MKSLRYTLLLAILSASGFNGYGVPALRQIRILTQPDGTQIEILKTGDEHRHFITTTDGHPLLLDADGFYRPMDTDLPYPQSPVAFMQQAPQTGMGLTYSTYPRTGSPKGLIILTEFSDVRFVTSDPVEYFHEMINGEDFSLYGATGSALKYFTDQSHGIFTPQFDVLGPVTLPQPQVFYGGNDIYGNDSNPFRMITDAIESLDQDVDFSQYDTDHDGVIDNVYLFYAGQGEADYGHPDTVWPHSWDLRNEGIDMVVDGVKVGKYACSNEWSKDSPVGIGTFVHEFSHVLGLPDLYPTNDNQRDYTPGKYSVLDQGPYNNAGKTPPNYSCYELNALGWAEPEMLNEPKTIELAEISSGVFGLIPTDIPTEFFLVENRQLTGWDAFIPNHGMLVWHIDYNESVFQGNIVNNQRQHPYVDIVEANNASNDPSGYTFPGTSNKNALTASTVPALRTWDNMEVRLPITNITERRRVITFDIAGGGARLGTPEPVISEWSEKERYFTVSWPEVEGAAEYILTVHSNDGSTLERLETGFDGSELTEGWNASETSWNITTGSYGDAAPSYKFGKNSQLLRSPKTPSGITSLEFWAKGMNTEASYLTIEGLLDEEWYRITDYTPAGDLAEYVTVSDDILPGTNQIRFKMVRKKGSILIDDVTIEYGDRGEVLPGYDQSVTDSDFATVTDLPYDKKHYYLTVSASDGNATSTSPVLYFELKGESENAEAPTIETGSQETMEYYNLQGIRVLNPAKGQPYIVKTAQSNKIMIMR